MQQSTVNSQPSQSFTTANTVVYRTARRRQAPLAAHVRPRPRVHARYQYTACTRARAVAARALPTIVSRIWFLRMFHLFILYTYFQTYWASIRTSFQYRITPLQLHSTASKRTAWLKLFRILASRICFCVCFTFSYCTHNFKPTRPQSVRVFRTFFKKQYRYPELPRVEGTAVQPGYCTLLQSHRHRAAARIRTI